MDTLSDCPIAIVIRFRHTKTGDRDAPLLIRNKRLQIWKWILLIPGALERARKEGIGERRIHLRLFWTLRSLGSAFHLGRSQNEVGEVWHNVEYGKALFEVAPRRKEERVSPNLICGGSASYSFELTSFTQQNEFAFASQLGGKLVFICCIDLVVQHKLVEVILKKLGGLFSFSVQNSSE